jgi:hypothetical protein
MQGMSLEDRIGHFRDLCNLTNVAIDFLLNIDHDDEFLYPGFKAFYGDNLIFHGSSWVQPHLEQAYKDYILPLFDLDSLTDKEEELLGEVNERFICTELYIDCYEETADRLSELAASNSSSLIESV